MCLTPCWRNVVPCATDAILPQRLQLSWRLQFHGGTFPQSGSGSAASWCTQAVCHVLRAEQLVCNSVVLQLRDEIPHTMPT